MLLLVFALGCDEQTGGDAGDTGPGSADSGGLPGGDAATGGDVGTGPEPDATPGPGGDAGADPDVGADPDLRADPDPAATPGPGPGGDAGADAAPLPDAGEDPEPGTPTAKRVVAYFTAWSVYDRNFHVADIPADKLTHINYAFINVSADGDCIHHDSWADVEKPYPGDTWDDPLRGNFNQLAQLKARHPHLRTLISVGGWTLSDKFSGFARTPEGRARFARSCADFMERFGFDGIDVDWEYPVDGGLVPGAPEDRENYTLLLEAVRRELDTRGAEDGRHYLLTIAAPAGPAIRANLEVPEVAEILDWINIMAYDFMGGWSNVTGFNAPMRTTEGSGEPEGFSVTDAVEGYLAEGVRPDKLVLGVPFYGRSFQGAPPTDNGIFQPFTGLGPGTWENGVLDYKDIVARYLPTLTRHWSEHAQVPWLHDPATGVVVSYDDPQSLGVKARYAREKGLGGVMIWELSSDDAADTLLDALLDGLR